LKVNNTRRLGFTLVEVLIVVVIMAVLAAVVIPQFGASTDDARKSAAEFNLSIMRSSLQTYIGQHGLMPVINGNQDLGDVMTNKTRRDGTVDNTNGIYGPYVNEFPENTFTRSANVKIITNNPATLGDVTAGGGGWLYNETTGGLWLDRNPGYDW
jgi:prepilin-type N-terminal cleavage/methylation domain-containing protein